MKYIRVSTLLIAALIIFSVPSNLNFSNAKAQVIPSGSSSDTLTLSSDTVTRSFSYPTVSFLGQNTANLTQVISWYQNGTTILSDNNGNTFSFNIPASDGTYTILQNSTVVDQKVSGPNVKYDIIWKPVQNQKGYVDAYKFDIVGTSVNGTQVKFNVNTPKNLASVGNQLLATKFVNNTSVNSLLNNTSKQLTSLSDSSNSTIGIGIDWSDAISQGYNMHFDKTTASILIPVGKSFSIDPVTVDHSSNAVSPATTDYFEGERRVLIVGTATFAFYYDGSNIVYKTSTDNGQTWGSMISTGSGGVSNDYFRWGMTTTTISGTTYVTLAYSSISGSTTNFYATRGTVSGSTISWNSRILIYAPSTNANAVATIMGTDSNNNVFAAFRYIPSSSYNYVIFKSSDGGSTWSTSISPTDTFKTYRIELALSNLASGKMLFALTGYLDSEFTYFVYNGTTWGTSQTTSGSGLTSSTLKEISSVSNSTNSPYIAYLTGGNSGTLKVAIWNSTGSFSSFQTVDSTLSHALPSIFMPSDGRIHIFTLNSSKIWQTVQNGNGWYAPSNPFGTTFDHPNDLTSAASVSSALWMENTTAPYAINYATLTKFPPTSLTATSINTTQIKLSWTAPASHNDATVTGYKIQSAGSTWTDVINNTGNTNTQYNATNLSSNTKFVYRIAAWTSNGLGLFSANVTGHTFANPPSALLITPKSTSSFRINWAAPGGTDTLTGYKIERQTNGGSFSTLVSNTGNATTHYDNTGLSMGTTYGYRISSINSAGTGNPSSVLNATSAITSSDTRLDSSGIQRASYFDGNYYWVFYYDGSNIVYRYSHDNGTTLSTPTSTSSGTLASNSYFTVYGESNKVVISYATSSNVLTKTGTITGTSISWSSPVTVYSVSGTNSGHDFFPDFEKVGSNLFLGFNVVTGGLGTERIYNSTTLGSSWTYNITFSAAQTHPASIALAKYANTKLVAIVARYDSGELEYSTYNGTGWSPQVYTTGAGVTNNAVKSTSMSAASNGTCAWIGYVKDNSGGPLKTMLFCDPTNISFPATGVSTTNFEPSISKAGSNMRLFYIRSNDIYAITQNGTSWGPEFTVFNNVTNAAFPHGEKNGYGGNHVPVEWREGTVSPYTVRFEVDAVDPCSTGAPDSMPTGVTIGGSNVWVALYGSGMIGSSSTSHCLVTLYPGRNTPTNLAIAQNGLLAFTQKGIQGGSNPSCISTFDTTTHTINDALTVCVDGAGAEDITADPTSTNTNIVWASWFYNSFMTKYNTVSGQTNVVSVPITPACKAVGLLSTPTGIRVDSNGNVWVANTGCQVIQEFITSTHTWNAPISINSYIPDYLDIDNVNNQMWITSEIGNKITELDLSNNMILLQVTPPTADVTPFQVTVDPAYNKAYFSFSTSGTVDAINTQSHSWICSGSNVFGGAPEGIAHISPNIFWTALHDSASLATGTCGN